MLPHAIYEHANEYVQCNKYFTAASFVKKLEQISRFL